MAKLIRRLAALAAPLAFILAVALPALADTYIVNDIADIADDNIGDGICHTASGTCTLRAAVQEANAHAGADSISFPAGTYVLTQTGFGEDNAVTGDLDITGNLVITGTGAATTIVDGNRTDRVFHILVSSGQAVALSGLTVRNGNAHPDGANGISSGGGIFMDYQSTLTLPGVDVLGNSAGSGGGVNNYNGILTINGGRVESNTTQYEGGGIGSGGYYYASSGSGSAPSEDKTPKPIQRVPGPADFGQMGLVRGPITATATLTQTQSPAARLPAPNANATAFAFDTIILNATTIANNFADGYGGGGVYASGPLTVTDSLIVSNTTGNLHGYGDGAGIEIYDQYFISGTRFISNTALFDDDDDSGGFQFPNLQAGTYTLTEIQPAAYTDGADAAGTLGGTVSNDQIANIFVGDAGYGQG
ncbi:MAG: hypothetical protein ABIQ99_03390, partial [Thermoflexales bacterium]